jgi:hypothetical protein
MHFLEVTAGLPIELTLSCLGGGAGDRSSLSFDTIAMLETYLCEKMFLPGEVISDFRKSAESGTGHRAVFPLPTSVVEQFQRDLAATAHFG